MLNKNHACQTQDGLSYWSDPEKVHVIQAEILSKITAEYRKIQDLIQHSGHECGGRLIRNQSHSKLMGRSSGSRLK